MIKNDVRTFQLVDVFIARLMEMGIHARYDREGTPILEGIVENGVYDVATSAVSFRKGFMQISRSLTRNW